MNKIKLFLNKDHRILMTLFRISTWILSIITLIAFIVSLIDCIHNNSLTSPSIITINTFLLVHEKFYKLYGANITLVIAYIAIKQYLHSNTMQTLDFYYEKLVPTAHETIKYTEKKLSKRMISDDLINHLKKNKNIIFTNEELKKLDSNLYDELCELHTNNLKFQTKAVLTLGYLESFSIKLTRGLVDYKLIEEACAKAFCVQVRELYPLISLTRKESDRLYFKTVVYLFNKWKDIL
ncbi:hypothetical protein [Flavobacterium sp. 5]|uniref:hypothetical protein n=1 Tax=Flavobacterium sp. 5 TaxID=2035199 RepID=UPI000CAD8C36|nr:hypothetical protein [Flavobacterium sp. 5]PKB16132.1 hypothetical protein CLU82_1254 [Flavobacterium sp. 5]